MQRFNLELGYVLHRRPYQETSLILDLFTREHGRLSAIAKGARRPQSKAKGLLQPFVPLLLSCQGRGELLTLKEFDNAGGLHFLQGRALLSGFYINELMIRLMHRFDPHQDLFDAYEITLKAFAQSEPEEPILRLFEKSLLKSIGYDLPLNKVAETGSEVEAEAWYLFDPEHGPSRVEHPERIESTTRRVLIIKGSSLLALHHHQLTEKTVLLDAKRMMRAALQLHLGARPLETRRLF